jgi:hypothetical protein
MFGIGQRETPDLLKSLNMMAVDSRYFAALAFFGVPVAR